MKLDDISELRRYFRREMFRIQAASMCQRVPVFETLQQTSDLADTAIAACYRMAVEHVARIASARYARLSTAPAADGDRAGAAWECASSTWLPTPTWYSSCRMKITRNTCSGRAWPSAWWT